MSVRQPDLPIQPPERLRAEVLRVAEQLLPSRLADADTAWAVDDSSSAIQVGAVRPLYSVGLDAIAAGRGAEAAELIGWRTLVLFGEEAVAMADTGLRGEPQVQSMNYGPFVAGLSDAGRVSVLRSRADFAERVLVVPALYLTALWLHHDEDPSRDEVIPAAPAPSGITANEPIRFVALLDGLAETARSRLREGDESDA
jgi:hypothetical protein